MQNQPDPTGPEDSTADLSDSPEGLTPDNSISLTQDQAKAAGIDNPEVGDQYTVTLNISDTSAGVTGKILDGSAQKLANEEGEDTEDQENANGDENSNDEMAVDQKAVTPKKPKPKQRVMSPSDMGISMTSGL